MKEPVELPSRDRLRFLRHALWIVPLVVVGVLFFQERLRGPQTGAILLAAVGLACCNPLQADLTLTQLANAGVILDDGEARIMIDGMVVEACRKHLPQTAACLDAGDPRFTLTIGDGVAFVQGLVGIGFEELLDLVQRDIVVRTGQ